MTGSLLTGVNATADSWVSNITTGSAQAVAFTPDGTKAYVVAQGGGAMHVIDATASPQTSTNVTIPGSSNLFGVAVSPDGSKAYALDDTNPGAVWVVDVATDTVNPTPITVGNSPHGLAFSPDGTTAYVTNFQDGTVSVIDVATDAVSSTITLPVPAMSTPSFPWGVAVSPDGSKVYATDSVLNQVWVIDAATNTVDATTPTIAVGNQPTSVAFSPDSTTAYVTNFDSYAGNTVSAIDVGSNSVAATITVGSPGSGPVAVAFSPGGSKAYVTLQGNATVAEIDVATQAVTAVPLTAAGGPNGIAFRPQGSTQVYTANLSGSVSVIDVLLAPVHGPATPGNRLTGSAFSFTIPESGNPFPSFSLTSGSLPPGVTLNTSTGVISGTPTTPGSYTYGITATNSQGTDLITYTQVISTPAPPTHGPAVPGTAPAGTAFSFAIPESGNPAPTFAVTSGSLPPGLVLNTATGVISGTPTTVGSYTYTITATNSQGTDAVSYTQVIIPPATHLPVVTG
jgi:YVTN family beta-propeller protein